MPVGGSGSRARKDSFGKLSLLSLRTFLPLPFYKGSLTPALLAYPLPTEQDDSKESAIGITSLEIHVDQKGIVQPHSHLSRLVSFDSLLMFGAREQSETATSKRLTTWECQTAV